MSHALGKAIFPDGLEMFFEYDGTSDYARANLFSTADEVDNQWRQDQEKRPCSCGGSEAVELQVDYGDGILFGSTACRHCKVITGPRCFADARESGDCGW